MSALLTQLMADKILVATGAGTTDTLEGDIVDLAGCEGALGIAILGAITNTGVVTLKAFTGNVATLTDGAYEAQTATVTGTAVAAFASDHLLLLDVHKCGKRYVRFDLVRATANVVVDGVIALRYGLRVQPGVEQADVADAHVSVN